MSRKGGGEVEEERRAEGEEKIGVQAQESMELEFRLEGGERSAERMKREEKEGKSEGEEGYIYSLPIACQAGAAKTFAQNFFWDG